MLMLSANFSLEIAFRENPSEIRHLSLIINPKVLLSQLSKSVKNFSKEVLRALKSP